MTTSQNTQTAIQEAAEVLGHMGVDSFGAALPEGKIHWKNRDGKIIAHAECKVIFSYAATNNSIMWGEAIPGYKSAGVPFLPKPEDKKEIAVDYSEAKARLLALATASGHNAEFVYAASTGAGGYLFLAIYNFTPGTTDLGDKDIANRLFSIKHFNREMSENLLDSMDQEDFEEVKVLLEAWKGKLYNQYKYVVNGLKISEQVKELMERIDTWLEWVDGNTKKLLKALEKESESWD